MRDRLAPWMTAAILITAAPAQGAEQAAGQEKAPLSPRTEEINAADYDWLRVGAGDGQRIVVPTNQVLSPAGRQAAFSGRPTDIALSPDGRRLAVLDRSHVAIIDPESAQIVSRLPHASGS